MLSCDPTPPEEAPRRGRPRRSWQDTVHWICGLPLAGDLVAVILLGLLPHLLLSPFRAHLARRPFTLLLGLLFVGSDFVLRAAGLRLRPLRLPGWWVGALLVLGSFLDDRAEG